MVSLVFEATGSRIFVEYFNYRHLFWTGRKNVGLNAYLYSYNTHHRFSLRLVEPKILHLRRLPTDYPHVKPMDRVDSKQTSAVQSRDKNRFLQLHEGSSLVSSNSDSSTVFCIIFFRTKVILIKLLFCQIVRKKFS